MTPLHAESVYSLGGCEESVRLGLYLNWESGISNDTHVLRTRGGNSIRTLAFLQSVHGKSLLNI